MRLITAFTAASVLITSLAWAGDSVEKLAFRETGFSIAPLEEHTKAPRQVVMMFLSASDGFSPNVNVQIQPYTDSIDAYTALSRSQFREAGLKVLTERLIDESEVVFEYTGTIQGNSLHWYARAVLVDETIYLITATATPVQWTKIAGKLKACVDSFEIMNDSHRQTR